EPEFLPARRRDSQRLEPTTDVVGIDDLLAGELLSVADRFGDDRGVHDAAVVEVFADLIFQGLALALFDDVFDDVLHGRIAGADAVEVERQVALAAGRGRARVVLAARPPDADEVIHRVLDLRAFLHRRRTHRAPPPHDQPARGITAHVGPKAGLVLRGRGRHGIFFALKTVLLAKVVGRGDGFAPVPAVKVDVADGFALEFVEPAFLLG